MTRIASKPDPITVRGPFRVVKRGGRKDVQLPEGASIPRRTDNTLVKALARAFRWKRMIESGEFVSISELAAKEGIVFTYMARLMRLSLLAPDMVDTIVNGRQPANVTLANLMGPFPLEWKEQRMALTQERDERRNDHLQDVEDWTA